MPFTLSTQIHEKLSDMADTCINAVLNRQWAQKHELQGQDDHRTGDCWISEKWFHLSAIANGEQTYPSIRICGDADSVLMAQQGFKISKSLIFYSSDWSVWPNDMAWPCSWSALTVFFSGLQKYHILLELNTISTIRQLQTRSANLKGQ